MFHYKKKIITLFFLSFLVLYNNKVLSNTLSVSIQKESIIYQFSAKIAKIYCIPVRKKNFEICFTANSKFTSQTNRDFFQKQIESCCSKKFEIFVKQKHETFFIQNQIF